MFHMEIVYRKKSPNCRNHWKGNYHAGRRMSKNFYHNRFWSWIEKKNVQLGNWLWAKRWRNFKKL